MEIQTKVKIKPWGNSLGIIIPKDVVIKEELQENDEVTITINKKSTLIGLFGRGKGIKINTQKMKDEAREEWLMD
jgi:antitoxin component of MazEF toxin-antitoxin module